ncbi:peptidyl-lys metalloendopeptidase [Rhizoctonia solani AG-3 Rhs1AP]|uniref:Peptidyl-lys metalloendopeptidase n=1 Tax=Rhizoctonia solani AG-3 Rhs1AP TaxID=1086054 RepID=X8J519_9AGAM|nr:peptidyl-lys metalloendopeptidase [Rhizoctonia solani AG-3 Rhs1AP]
MIFSVIIAGLWVTSTLAAPATFNSAFLARRSEDELGSLVLAIRAQDDVNDPDDLTVASTIINTGNTTLKLLNDPNGPLSTWKTHTFEFYEVPAGGSRKRATGSIAGVNAIRVKYNPDVAASLSNPSAYTVLNPGENKTVVHDLSGMYNFQTTGAYEVRATTNAEWFRIIKDDGSVGYVKAKIYDAADAANWTATHINESGTFASMRGLINAGIPTHSLARRWEENTGLSKRVLYNNCSAMQEKDILQGVAGANSYITQSVQFLSSSYYLGNSRYRTWFGPYNKKRWDTVARHFALLHGQPPRFRYDCSCTEEDTFAYVYPNQFGTVYLCGAFWRAPVMGRDSRAGTIVHEATHFTQIAGTDDHAYGHEEAQTLAINFPDQAIMNADSHEYFAENDPVIA